MEGMKGPIAVASLDQDERLERAAARTARRARIKYQRSQRALKGAMLGAVIKAMEARKDEIRAALLGAEGESE